MRSVNLLALLFILSSFNMVHAKNSRFSQKLLSLPNLTHEVTKKLPSLLLTSADDSRIDKLAFERGDVFLIKIPSQNEAEDIIVLVNPNSVEGILWWKKPTKLVLTIKRWNQLTEVDSKLTDDEKIFFSKLAEFNFLLDSPLKANQ
jgi:hypothetical protein